jgi:replicative DNA helicase
MKETEDFSKYGKSFQENLCHLILVDRPFADQIFEVLDINFLELNYLQVFVKKIFDYRSKYGVHPTSTIMRTVIRTEIENEPESNRIRIRDYFASILVIGEIESSEYIKETALNFCKKQKLKEALIKSVDLIKNSSFDEVASVINEAINLGSDNDFGYDYLIDFEERFKLVSRNPIPTGWKLIDDVASGGLGSGELGVVIAPTGAGKSMALVHIGAEAIKAGKTVIHYTLELSDTIVASRYDSCITKVHLMDLIPLKEKIYEEIKELTGKLIVKEYPTRSASIQTIKNHLERMSNRGIHPDIILLDYADLIKPVFFKKDEKRHQLEAIYEELRGLAQIYACPVWTASQTNRSGLNAEVITMESISEAFNKCFVADFIFTLSRTIEDKNTNGGRIFVAKNRNGPDGMVYPVFMDTSNVTIKVLEPNLDEDIPDIRVKAKEKMKKIRQMYKGYKEEEKNGTV